MENSNGNSNHELVEIPERILKVIKRLALFFFILILVGILFVDFFRYYTGWDDDYLSKHEKTRNAIETLKTIGLESLPILFLTLFIEPVIKWLNFIKNKAVEIQKKEEDKKNFEALGIRIIEQNSRIDDLTQQLNLLTRVVGTEKYFPEISNISYSYNNTDWKALLANATHIDLCILYTSSEWNQKNFVYFKNLLERDGTISLYLPNFESLSSRYYTDSKLNSIVISKIWRTYSVFNNLPEKLREKCRIYSMTKGFNYMFARIHKPTTNLFLMSPYNNNYSKVDSPAIIFDEKFANEELLNFINTETEYLSKADVLPNFEKEKYIVWNEKRNKVFISTELKCQLGCTFCYVDSLTKKIGDYDPIKVAHNICEIVKNDNRFIPGKDGTTIMLGSFNDPFFSRNFQASMEIINSFASTKNFIHIATRYCVGKNKDFLFSKDANVVINYSISTLVDNGIEVRNQMERFDEAKKLILKGYKIALFIRPIIKDVTIMDIDKIIQLAKDANITIVTVGGLYVDDRIRHALEDIHVTLDDLDYLDKQFVLDDKNVLKKLKINDINTIVKKLKDNQFTVFESSDTRVEYFNTHY